MIKNLEYSSPPCLIHGFVFLQFVTCSKPQSKIIKLSADTKQSPPIFHWIAINKLFLSLSVSPSLPFFPFHWDFGLFVIMSKDLTSSVCFPVSSLLSPSIFLQPRPVKLTSNCSSPHRRLPDTSNVICPKLNCSLKFRVHLPRSSVKGTSARKPQLHPSLLFLFQTPHPVFSPGKLFNYPDMEHSPNTDPAPNAFSLWSPPNHKAKFLVIL